MSTQDKLEAPTQTSAIFYTVSMRKLFIMQLATFGLYSFYWFYRNWKIIKDLEQARISPFLRSLFSPIFGYSCFYRIRNTPQTTGIQPDFSAGWLAFGWLIFVYPLFPTLAYLSTFAFVFILPVQSYVNAVNAVIAPAQDRNDRFSALNWLAIGMTGFLYLYEIYDSWTLP